MQNDAFDAGDCVFCGTRMDDPLGQNAARRMKSLSLEAAAKSLKDAARIANGRPILQ
ncbi:MAG: hypothetical protein ACLUI3_02705 [Christensenellales bacterium]